MPRTKPKKTEEPVVLVATRTFRHAGVRVIEGATRLSTDPIVERCPAFFEPATTVEPAGEED